MITLIAFVLGILGGVFVPGFMQSVSFLGDIYINLLKIIMIPVLFFDIVCAVSNGTNMAKITIKTILLFIGMFLATFLITCGLVTWWQPGVGFNFVPVEWTGEITSLTFKEFIVSLIPTNIITAAANNSILPVILFAFAIGIALNVISKDYNYKDAKVIYNYEFVNHFNKGCNQIFNTILGWIMKLTPIGVFALIGNTVASYGMTIIGTTAKYILCAWIISLICVFVVMIMPVWAVCKINPISYFKKVKAIWAVTLSTCSSAATLPTTIKICNEEFGVPEEITNIVVPLGCTIHMCGGAVSFALLALFNCQMFGIAVTVPMFIIMVIAALLINMGAPGIPGGGIVIGATYLTILGIPIDFIGVYAGIYRLLDMIYTTLNVTGDITANVLIHKSNS